MAFSDDFLSEIRSRCDIEATISSYVNLKRAGRISKGLCPFHNEKTPSFTVYPDTQSYYCFGCGSGGDVITFIRNIENLDYLDAVRFLADKAGLSMPQENSIDTGLNKRRLRLLEANREAARFYHKVLYSPEGRAGLEYFQRRGLTPATIKSFGLGFAPNSFSALCDYLIGLGYTKNEIVDANLARRSQKNEKYIYDNFRNRIMFPIIDVKGSVIAFGGRVMDDSKPKYLNTSDTPVYKKSKGVFALNLAKKSTGGALILCEGYMDVIALHQAGFNNAVAGLGTALTSEQALLLSRYANEILISYDADEAGQKAAARALQIFEKTPVKIKILRLSGGKDPDEIIKNYGPEKMRSIIEGAANEIEFSLLREKGKFDLATDDGKRQYLISAAGILANVSEIERDIYASRLSEELGVSKDAIIRTAQRNRKKQEPARQKKAFAEIQRQPDLLDKLNPQRKTYFAAARAEETLIASVMANPELLDGALKRISPEDFVTDFNARIFKAVTDRMRQGKPTQISYLHGELTETELSALANIQSVSHLLQNSEAECGDCINIILSEKNKKSLSDIDVDNISDEDFLKFFKNN